MSQFALFNGLAAAPTQTMFPNPLQRRFHRRLSVLLALFAVTQAVGGEVYRATPGTLIELTGDGATREFALPHVGILRGSEEVVYAGRVLAPLADYRLDYDAGRLLLLTVTPQPGEVVQLSYRYLPLTGVEPPELRLTGEYAQYVGVGDRLEITGSKGLGLRLDAGGVGLEQSLDVSLSGELTSGLRLEGVLSDQDLPVSVAGTTAELEELDEVRLSAWTEELRLDLGDYDLSGPTGKVEERYGPGERRLEGGQVRLDYEAWGLRAVLSRAPGQTTAQRFTPEPGVAGPYFLESADGETNLVVVPGSEEVYLEGRRLRRGRDADYVIDYTLGALTFNPTLGFPTGAEVLVRFEYTSRGYRRDLYGGGLRLALGPTDWSVAYYHEADDVEADLWGMTETDRLLLEGAGDEPVELPLEGEYSFEYVGAGAGDYELVYDEDTGGYEFVPSPGGGYRRKSWVLPAPRRHSLALLTGGLSAAGLEGELELALSDYDANTLSGRHDDDNAGLAGRLELEGAWELGAGRLLFEADAERRGAEFTPSAPGDTAPSFYERWGLTPEEALREHLDGRLGWRFAEGPTLWLSGAGLWLTAEAPRTVYATPSLPALRDWFRRQYELGAALEWPAPLGLEYGFTLQRGLTDRRASTALRPADDGPLELAAYGHRLALAPDLGWLKPRFGLDYDERRGAPDRLRLDYSAGVSLRPGPSLVLAYDYLNGRQYGAGLEWDRPLETGSQTHLVGLDWRPTDSGRLSLDYRRRSAFDRRDEPREPTGVSDAGRLGLDWTLFSGGLALNADYELGRSWSYPYVEQYVYSPDGVGNYRREPDPDNPDDWIYIFDPGDPEAYYDRELLPAGEPERAVDAAGSLALSLRPRRFCPAGWAELFELNATLRAANEGPGSTLQRALLTNLFDEDAATGEVEARIDLELWPVKPRGGAALEFVWTDGLDARIKPRRERYGSRSWSLRADYAPFNDLRLYAGGAYEEEWRSGALSYFGAGDADRAVDGWRLWLEPRLSLGDWRPRLRAERRVSLQRSAAGDSRLATWALTPALQLSLGGWGSLELSWRRREHTLDGPPTTESLLYRRPGVDHRWRAWLGLNLGVNLALSLSYTGENEPGRETVHRGSLDAKVFF
ncbi:MAG: hypothetical protein GF399_00205 [Candidatus Coatesbacteria bacterium]|nr:hypothetical protein [Candidatus Coatesbacteria bacterium]